MAPHDPPRRRNTLTRLLPGLALGLWLSRLVAESSLEGWRLVWLLPLIAVGVALGLGAATWLRRGAMSTWPLTLLWGYVLWPSAARWLGLALGALALILLLRLHGPRLRHWVILPGAVFLAALALYGATLAPDMLPADAGEFQLVGHLLGIAHPPGYALYTLLNKLVTLLPLGSVAYRVNLFAALCGATTLALLAHCIHWRTGSTSAALLACAMLGLSATFWVQSTTANIRSLTVLFEMACIAGLLHWQETREDPLADRGSTRFWFRGGSSRLAGVPQSAVRRIRAGRRAAPLATATTLARSGTGADRDLCDLALSTDPQCHGAGL